MDEEIMRQNINILNISSNIIHVLNIKNIKTIGQLCKKTKTDLKNLNIIQNDIKKIEVELQLLGLNLKNNL